MVILDPLSVSCQSKPMKDMASQMGENQFSKAIKYCLIR